MPHLLTFFIAMVSVFLVFSGVVSGAVEAWNSAFNKRGTFFWRGIARLVGTTASPMDLLADLQAHPTLRALCQDDSARGSASYIPGALFADALLDVVLAHGATARLSRYGPAEAIALLPDDLPLKRTLLLEWAKAQGDAARLRSGIARLFDDCMDRVGGWYKRDAQLRGFWIGLAIACAFDLDAVHIAIALWQSPDVANQLADQAAISGSAPMPWPAQIPAGWPATWFGAWSAGGSGHGLAWQVVATIVGVILMAVSGAIGAPTWFQLLSLLVPMRGSGKPPASSTPAAPRDARPDARTPDDAVSHPFAPAVPAAPDPGLNELEKTVLEDGRVTRIRQALGLASEGGFDSALRTAVRELQARKGYAPTGQLTRLLLQDLP